jgi:hypothetical protein
VISSQIPRDERKQLSICHGIGLEFQVAFQLWGSQKGHGVERALLRPTTMKLFGECPIECPYPRNDLLYQSKMGKPLVLQHNFDGTNGHFGVILLILGSPNSQTVENPSLTVENPSLTVKPWLLGKNQVFLNRRKPVENP